MTKYLNDSRPVFNTSMVTDDISSSLKVALMLTSLSSWTTMLSFGVKRSPLIFTFVPPNINEVIWWEILLNKKKADECNWVTYTGKMVLEFQLQLAMTEISARNCLDESGHSLSAKSVARVQKIISEEKLMIVRLLNVVKICGSSFVGSFSFFKRHILWSKVSTICNTSCFAVKIARWLQGNARLLKNEVKKQKLRRIKLLFPYSFKSLSQNFVGLFHLLPI